MVCQTFKRCQAAPYRFLTPVLLHYSAPVVWRTNLRQSEQYWTGWYSGLSDMYLSVTAPKILILAGTDRLDKPLTIGQMQVKFQMSLLPQVHAVLGALPQRPWNI